MLLTEAGQYLLQVDILTSLARTWNPYIDMSDSQLAKDAFDCNIRLMGAASTATSKVHPGPLRWSHVCPWHRLWLLMTLPSILTCAARRSAA